MAPPTPIVGQHPAHRLDKPLFRRHGGSTLHAAPYDATAQMPAHKLSDRTSAARRSRLRNRRLARSRRRMRRRRAENGWMFSFLRGARS
jgi:hypothetical protein